MLCVLLAVAFSLGGYWARAAPEMSLAISLLIVCEAWRRYFRDSPKVRETFGNTEDQDFAQEPLPAGVGLLAMFSWQFLTAIGLNGTLLLVWSLTSSSYTEGSIKVFFGVASLVGYIVPFLILSAVSVRKGMRGRVLLGLGIWVGASFISLLIPLWMFMSRYGPRFDNMSLAEGLFLLGSGMYLVMGLVFWRYAAVSETAEAWFAETTEA